MIRFFSARTALSTGLALAAFSTGLYAQTLTKGSTTPIQSPYQGTVVEDIIARVNDGIISRSDYDHALDDLNATAKQRNWSEAEIEAQKKDLLRDLIDNQLLLSKGKELGITGETETVRQLDELRKQNHLETMEDLQKAAEQQGVSFEDFKASIRNRVITSQVIREEVGRRINISQGDEQAYYEAHKSEFDRPEQVKLSEILVPTANPDDAAQVAEAEKKANELEAQLKAGKDFAAVAKTGSGGPTAAQGGEIGEFKRGQLAKVLEDQTFSLDPGKYTAPIRTKQGYVILKVDEHQAGGIAPFKDVEGEIQDRVGMSKMNPALRSYMQRLREEAYVDIKPGYVDSGATPNQTKPIFSAYAPPTPKKKKKLERTRFGGRGRTRMATRQTASAAAPAVPSGVPSLADVPQADANTATVTPAGSASAPAPAESTSSSSKNRQVASLKPGKKEKIRFGQAPRETLPAGPERSEDAGATTANGNSSVAETARAAEQAGPNNGAAPGQSAPTQVASVGSAPAGARYSTGESAGEDAALEKPAVKTRFSARPVVKKDKAAKAKKTDPFAPAPAAPDEVATQATQDRPLGLAGDTSKKPPKVKATGPKVRYADMPHDKPADTPASGPAGAPSSVPATAPAAAPAPNTAPASAPGSPAPTETQKTPNGTGDPLGPATPGTPSATPNGTPQ